MGAALLFCFRQPIGELLAAAGDQAAVSARLAQFGPVGPLLLGLILLFQVIVVAIPGHILMISGGYVYGFGMGFCLSLVSTVGGNRLLLSRLQAGGVQVDLFRPAGRRLSQFNRLHVKVCAVDQATVLMGGSNIGDHYLGWRDTNICLKGDFGDTFARLYGYLRQFSSLNATRGTAVQTSPQIDLPVQDASLLFTVPGRRQDIRRTLLELILEAERSVNIRSWYFLPDQEILNALLSQAERGVDVTVLFSDRTRVPFIDAANRMVAHKLAQSGVCVQRYRGRYMHAKEAWNDKGQILFGSANIDPWALGSNFECDLQLHDSALAQQLQQALHADRDNWVGWNSVRPGQPVISGFRL